MTNFNKEKLNYMDTGQLKAIRKVDGSNNILNPLTEDTLVLKVSDLSMGRLDAGEVDELIKKNFGDIVSMEKDTINGVSIAGDEIVICLKKGKKVQYENQISLKIVTKLQEMAGRK